MTRSTLHAAQLQEPVVVVGGGVMGMCSAVRLLEAGHTDVTLIAERSTRIASKSSPAVFRPDYVGDTAPERVVRWALATREHLRSIYRDQGSEAGVTSLTHLEIYRTEGNEGSQDPGPILPKVMDGFRAMTPFELATHFPAGLADGGWHYSSFVIEGSRYLPFLTERAQALGLRILQHAVAGVGGSLAFCQSAVSIAQRRTCRVVINAMGEAGGPECLPIRGQLVLVKAPYVKMAMGEYAPRDRSMPTYIYPRRDHVVLGSTYLEGDADRELREETTRDIVERCAQFVPELRDAPILSEVVCLRPGRKQGVRLEHTRVGTFSIVSNYGHGGAGMSLAWGCAGEVLELVQGAVMEATADKERGAWRGAEPVARL